MAQGFTFKGDFAELELAAMCRRFNALPSEVLREDAFLMRRTFALVLELDKVEADMIKRRSRGR